VRILIVSDAWYPQVNGVVRTLSTLARVLKAEGHKIVMVTPDLVCTVPLPGIPDIKLALYPDAKIARVMYHENYIALPMQHHVVEPSSTTKSIEVTYRWRDGATWNSIGVESSGQPTHPEEGSFEQFITEHYWGYVRQPDGGCVEYRVEHVPWRVWNASRAKYEGDTTRLYGAPLARCLTGEPDSAFLAEGSSVAVYWGHRIA